MEQRIIKFKAKRLDNDEWVKGDLSHEVYRIGGDYRNYTTIRTPIKNNHGETMAHTIYQIDPSTVCQFTGIYDKHGLEVWEHDILIVNVYRGEVVYNKGGFAVNNGHMEIAIDTCIFQIPNSNRSHVINIGSKFDRKEEK